ncbi:MAG: SpoIIE family protein phosphatase [Desulfotalea sp.]
MKTIEHLTILFVDDEASVLNSLRRFLRKEKYKTLFAGSGKEALEILETQKADIIVTDLRMPEMSGLELIYEVKRLFPQTVRIILSASRDVEETIESINTGEIFRFIPKPLDPESFKQILLDASEYYLLTTERAELLEELAARNSKLESVNNNLQQMADSLRSSEEQFRTITEMANDAVIMTNEEEELIFWNRAAKIIFGYSADEVLGKKPYLFLVPEQYRKKYLLFRENVLKKENAKESRGIVKKGIALRKDGHEIPVELSSSIAYIQEKPHFISIIRDISKQVKDENARKRYKKLQSNLEAKIGKTLLQTDAPKMLNGVDIASLSIPSKHLDGDFTDFVVYGKGKFDILIADVMGKGLQAALVGAGIKASFLKVLSQHDCTVTPRPNCPKSVAGAHLLGSVVADVHAMTVSGLMNIETFATLCFSRFNLEKKIMAYVDCGHTKTIHYQASLGKCCLLDGDNFPLGVVEHESYHARVVPFQSGDIFLYYSDGISEAETEEGAQFGIKRLVEVVTTHCNYSSSVIIEKIKNIVREFTGKHQFDDDFTCIAVKIK